MAQSSINIAIKSFRKFHEDLTSESCYDTEMIIRLREAPPLYNWGVTTEAKKT